MYKYGKPINQDWVAIVVIPIQILLISGGNCHQLLLLRYTAENLQVT